MCQTTDNQTTQNTCPLKTYWQEKQCWEYQCDKVSGDTTCDNPFDGQLCEYQIQIQLQNKKIKSNKTKTTKPMKLKIYDNSQDNLNRQGKSTAALSAKSGIISFSQSCCQAVGISAGSKIALAQDETNPKDWYLIPFTGEEEHFFVFSPANGKSKEKQTSFKIQSKKLILTIFKSLNFSGETCKVPVATVPIVNEGKKIFAILTKSVNQDKK